MDIEKRIAFVSSDVGDCKNGVLISFAHICPPKKCGALVLPIERVMHLFRKPSFAQNTKRDECCLVYLSEAIKPHECCLVALMKQLIRKNVS